MLRKLIIAATFSFITLTAHATRSPGTYFQMKSDLGKLSQKNLVDWVNDLVKTSAPSRMVGASGHDKATTFIQETITKLDPKKTGKLSISDISPDVDEAKRFYQEDFASKVEGKIPKSNPDYQKWLRFTTYMQQIAVSLQKHPVKNIIWEKPGLDPKKILVITAHYDTISHDPNTLMIRDKDPMPGANYNATGVAVALGIIKALAEFESNYSVQVVFLDWQGVGFLGSYHHAQALKKSGQEILGVVNLEMLGQDTSFFDKTKKTGNMSVYLRSNTEEEKFVQKLLNHGSKMTDKVSFEFKPQGFENSDNIRYWEQGIKAATFSQNWEDDFNPKFFQTPQDTPETLNHQTLYNAYLFIGGSVIGTLLDVAK